jgi:hypothetical protein
VMVKCCVSPRDEQATLCVSGFQKKIIRGVEKMEAAPSECHHEFFQKEGSARDVRLESSAGRVGEGTVVLQCRRRSRLTDVVSCTKRSQLASRVD